MADLLNVQGVYAAVLVPRFPNGKLDARAFRAILEFLRARSLTKVVVNGATGEYCLTTPAELAQMLAICRETLHGGEVLCSIGAAGLPGCLELGRIAMEQGARALLLPMPHFFPYSQDDLRAFCTAVAASLDAPVLLYNLPRFTTPLELETVRALIDAVPNIIGIKDSSGSLKILGGLGSRACRIVGDDSVLVPALEAGLCDGVVSGVAGVLPELTTLLFERRNSAAVPAGRGVAHRADPPPIAVSGSLGPEAHRGVSRHNSRRGFRSLSRRFALLRRKTCAAGSPAGGSDARARWP